MPRTKKAPAMTPEQAFRATGAILRSAAEAGDEVAVAELARRKANKAAKASA